MNKPLMIFIMIALVIGAGLFSDQIAAIFHGMTPLQSLQFIWQFVLHVAVITIAVYVLQTLPEILKPWSKALGLRWRQARRGGGMNVQKASRTPRFSTDQLMRMYIAKQMTGGQKRQDAPVSSDDIDIRF